MAARMSQQNAWWRKRQGHDGAAVAASVMRWHDGVECGIRHFEVIDNVALKIENHWIIQQYELVSIMISGYVHFSSVMVCVVCSMPWAWAGC